MIQPFERIANFVLQLIIDLLRYADAFGFGKWMDSGSNVHGVPENVAAFFANNIAKMNSDSNLDVPLVFGGNVVVVQRFLDFNRTVYGVERAFKFDEERITN